VTGENNSHATDTDETTPAAVPASVPRLDILGEPLDEDFPGVAQNGVILTPLPVPGSREARAGANFFRLPRKRRPKAARQDRATGNPAHPPLPVEGGSPESIRKFDPPFFDDSETSPSADAQPMSGDAGVSDHAAGSAGAIPSVEPGPAGSPSEDAPEAMPGDDENVTREVDEPPGGCSGDETPTAGADPHLNEDDGDHPAAGEEVVAVSETSGQSHRADGNWIPVEDLLSRRVSVCLSVTGTTPDGSLSISEIVEAMRTAPEIREKVERVRNAVAECADREEVKRLKRLLPAFTASGEFSVRNTDGITAHSGILQGDFDAMAPCEVDDALRRVRTDPHVLVAFRSPSGKVKVLVAIPPNPGLHRRSFDAVERYFLDEHGLVMDPSTKDVPRACYFSHDPEPYVAAGEVLQFEPAAEERPARDEGRRQVEGGRCGHGPAGQSDYPLAMVRSALLAIPTRPPYEYWIKCVAAVKDAVPDRAAGLALLASGSAGVRVRIARPPRRPTRRQKN